MLPELTSFFKFSIVAVPNHFSFILCHTALLMALMLCSSLPVQAQNGHVTVYGSVTDSTKKMVLEGATVSTFRLPDSLLLGQTRTTREGFSLHRLSHGHNFLSVSFVGYSTRLYPLTISVNKTTVQISPFNLQPVSNTLAEVVVHGNTPIIARGDTLSYNAGAFKTVPNASVEDLLKKLPGVEVDEKGQITVNGQHVDKFYIDGKEIPVTDAKALTQSITADMLSSIETFDRQSNESKFSGIKDSDPAKAINFKVKKAFQQSINGRAFGGLGDAGHYAVGGNSFLLLPDTKLQFFINRNNSNDVLGMGGVRQRYVPPGFEVKTNLNLQGNSKLSEQVTVMGAYNFYENRNRSGSNGERQTFLIDSNLLSRSGSSGQSGYRGHQFNGELLWRPDSTTEISFKPQLRFGQGDNASVDSQRVEVQKNNGRYDATKANTTNRSTNNSTDNGGELSLRHRFSRKGQTAGMRVQWSEQTGSVQRQFYSHTQLFDSTGHELSNTILDQHSFNNAPSRTLGAGLNYTYPITPTLIIDANYNYSNTRQRSNKVTYNYNPITGFYDLEDSLTTNQFMNSLQTQRVGIGLNSNKKGFNYQVGAVMQYSNQVNDTYKGPGINFSQHYVNWFPRAMLSYTVNPRQQFFINYSGLSIQPTIYQLQPLPDFSNPLFIRKGNPDLAPEFDHTINVNYQLFSSDRMQSLLMNVSGFVAQRRLTQASNTLAGGVQETQFINLDGTRSLSAGINYNHSLGKGKKGNVRAGSTIRYSSYPGLVNNVSNIRESIGLEPNMAFNYTGIEKLLLEGSARWAFNKTNYSFSGANLQQLNQYYTFSFSLELPANFYTLSDYSLVITGAQGSLPGQHVGIWNANVAKRFLPKKNLELRFSGFDLLKSNKGYFQSVGENYISSRTSLILTRSLFVSVVYHFKAPLSHP